MTTKASQTTHPVVSHEEWLAARTALLTREKEFTRQRDQLSRHRRELPWEVVEKAYVFEGPKGRQALPDLFDGRHQLVVYHFMFDPTWDAGCPHCSFWADQFDGMTAHLAERDVTLVAISRAPFPRLAAYQKRMGWTFPWLSASETDFNFDYQVSFRPDVLARREAFFNYRVDKQMDMADREGLSVFYKDETGRVFHTYSAYARGIDMVNGAYQFLDLVPKGRDEDGHDDPQFWVRRHDEYRR